MDEFERLLFDWEDGTLDTTGTARLRDLLRISPEARNVYIQRQMFGAILKLEGEAGIASSNSEHSGREVGTDHARQGDTLLSLRVPNDVADVSMMLHDPKDSREVVHRRYRSLLFVVAASILLCVVLGRWLLVESRLQSAEQGQPAASEAWPGKQEATSAGIALVTRLVDVTWQDAEYEFTVGDALSAGVVGLDSGVAQIEFFCGATVILEGPAKLVLESSTVARLQSGRLRAQVPPAARGFQIHADELRVVDLGTEFGVAVSDGEADLQVFDGEVELHQPNGEQRLVSAGNAITHAAGGVVEAAELTPDEFLGLEALDDRVRNQKEDRYQRWLRHSMELRKDPRIITYYSMEQDRDWKRKLASSVVPENRDLDGAIVGAKRVVGRWPQKSAIEFKRPGDRIRVNIPGQFGSLTFACWVKIDSLDRWFNSLFLTDSYQRGEPHWQILDTGQLFFSVRRGGGPGKGHHKVLSPPFWDASLSGRWLHLATTYDVETKITRHFLNGEKLCEEPIPDKLFVQQTCVGKATIGNWSSPTRPEADFAIRNLNGSMDEFMLFRDALKPNEIRELFIQGRP
ncbi:MAG: iron dicitrate transport regulator FecR [Rhodopirellula sp.]|nr:iron dicitrate transport regulator FecR [Rhodopirellula sp.]OUX52329.1 MAG: hypothetical protein CBE43_00955 [Rhodopirellula sp. TMED283]